MGRIGVAPVKASGGSNLKGAEMSDFSGLEGDAEKMVEGADPSLGGDLQKAESDLTSGNISGAEREAQQAESSIRSGGVASGLEDELKKDL
jgi:hypothetical protein